MPDSDASNEELATQAEADNPVAAYDRRLRDVAKSLEWFCGLKLVLTCGMWPEQYDVFDSEGIKVGYLRLRHGLFTIESPGPLDTLLGSFSPIGDGGFENEERVGYLQVAMELIATMELIANHLASLIQGHGPKIVGSGSTRKELSAHEDEENQA